MPIETLSHNSIFAYIPQLEAVWGTLSLLTGEQVHSLCTEIYGAESVAVWKRKYAFLFETFHAIETRAAMNLPDFLLDLPMETFTLEGFRDTLLAMPAEEIIWRLLDLDYAEGIDRDKLSLALTEDDALDQLYSSISDSCGSFLGFYSFIRRNRRFLTEFFTLALELNNGLLAKALKTQEPVIAHLAQTTRQGIEANGPFAFSEAQMGKTFRNRGPYDEFIFLPTYLMPGRACRYFHTQGEHKRQILFLSIRDRRRDPEDTIRALKAISDGTRYQILTILATEGPLRGLDLAKRLSIATSTVSHHMDQLKESGLITEEPVKNAKYYGVNHQGAEALLEDLKKDLNL